MDNQEYEQKKRECWEEHLQKYGRPYCYTTFSHTFDRAYALGREKETITQEEIEKAAEEYSKHLGKSRDVTWNDAEYGFIAGANFALGKQEKNGIDLKKLNEMLDDTLKKETKESLNQWLSEKDADTVTIKKRKYYQLCKCARYMANWVPYFDVCPICGEYNQRGCICINCDNNKNWNNGE